MPKKPIPVDATFLHLKTLFKPYAFKVMRYLVERSLNGISYS